MGLFDFFKSPKSEADQVFSEILAQLFPGGDKEIAFRAQKVAEFCNGKLSLPDLSRVYTTTKARLWMAKTGFDGEGHLGPNFDRLLAGVKQDSGGKLSDYEACSIIYYAIFDKVDTAVDMPKGGANFFL